jgi:hypothetical protein
MHLFCFLTSNVLPNFVVVLVPIIIIITQMLQSAFFILCMCLFLSYIRAHFVTGHEINKNLIELLLLASGLLSLHVNKQELN